MLNNSFVFLHEMKPAFILFVCLLGIFPLQAQQTLSLEQCINQALEKNLQIQQAKIQSQQSELSVKQSKFEYLPSLNGSANMNRTFGTSFDQVTFQRIQKGSTFSSPQLNMSLTLFKGLSNYYTYKQNQSNLSASNTNIEVIQNNIVLQVIATYLQLIIDQSNISIQKDRIALLEKQLQKIQTMLDAGLKIQSDQLNIKSQLASEKLNLINFENQRSRDQLTLLQLIELENRETEIVLPPLNEKLLLIELPELNLIVQTAIQNMPEIKQEEYKLAANTYALKISQSGKYPSLSFNAGLSSSYSSNGGQMRINTSTGTIEKYRTGYANQLNDNFSQFVNFSLQIPIFNRWRTSQSIQNSRLNIMLSELSLKNQKNILTKSVQQAWLDAKNSKIKFEAVQEQLNSLDELFKNAEARYEAGNIDFYTYMETLNNKNKAQAEVLQSKYDLIMRLQILEVYKGNKPQL